MRVQYFIITVMVTEILKSPVSRIGRMLRAFREKTGRNLSDVAPEAGISVSMLSQIERGVVSPSIETLCLVCQALGFDIADVFSHLSQREPVRIQHDGRRLATEIGRAHV